MQYQIWVLRAIIFQMMSKVSCLLSSPDSSLKPTFCINLVAKRHFRSTSTVAVITTNFNKYQRPALFSPKSAAFEDSMVQLISLNTQFSLVTLKPNEESSYCSSGFSGKRAVDCFIFVGSADEIVSRIKTFCFGTLTSDLSHFLVYLKGKAINATKIVENVLKTFWKHHHQNVIVLIENPQTEVDVYTWFPLESAPEVRIVDQCNGKGFRNNTILFPSKLHHDLNGKVIRAGLVIAPIATCERIGGGYAGTEIEMVEAMASALNFTIVYSSSKELNRENDSQYVDWGGAYGPWKTIFLRSLSGDVDIALGGFTLISEQMDQLGYTLPFAKDTYRFYATNDLILYGHNEGWMGLMVLQMIVIHIFTTLTMHLLRPRAGGGERDFGATAIMVWSLLSDSTVKLSRLSLRQVLLWTVCAFYAININTAYMSILTSHLASPTYIENIATVKDMVESNLPFLLSTAKSITEIPLLSRDAESQLQNRLTACPEPLRHCLLKFVSVPHYSLSAYDRDMAFAQAVLPNRKYHRLDKKKGTTVYLAMYTTKNHFLARKMTIMILRSAQAGLLSYWFKKNLGKHSSCNLDDQYWMLLRRADAKRLVSETVVSKCTRPYTMSDLYSPFLFLGLGLVLAGVAFLMELLLVTISCKRLLARLKRYLQVTRGRILSRL